MRNASFAVALLGCLLPLTSCSSEKESPSGSGGSAGASGGAPGAICGNGVIESGETCDPVESCPAVCDDGNACTTNDMSGSAETCNVACSFSSITTCAPGDGCCPTGCNPSTDTDCSATCGDGTVDENETCDPPSTCPMSCDDGDACTVDLLTGSIQNCNVACSNSPITTCVSGDGCCPAGCTSASDSDCSGGTGGAGTGGQGTGGEGTGGGPVGSGGVIGSGGESTGGVGTGGVGTGGVGTGGVGTGGEGVGGGTGGEVVGGGTGGEGVSGGTGGEGTGGEGTGGIGTGGVGTGGMTCDENDIPDSPNTLGVSITTAEHVVSKEIFGLLMETLGNDVNNGVWVGTNSSIPNTAGVRNDIIEGMREAGVGAIEWPGGCAANNFNWEANLSPSNTMGVDRFMDFTVETGAEAVLVGRPSSQYADSNRQWIEYVNNNSSHPEWNLKYFKIGNEVWGCGGNLGHEPAGEATYEDWYNANWNVLSDLNLFLIGATAGIWTVDPNNSNDWINLMLGNIGDRMEGFEIHDYIYYPEDVPCVGFSDSEYYDILCLADECQLGPRTEDIRTIMDRHDPSGRLQIIEDEWGDWLQDWYTSDPNRTVADDWLQQNTVMDALSAAITLNLFVRNADRIRMAGLAQAVNVIHSLFLTNSANGGSDLVKTPTFYVFKLMVPHHTNNARYAPVTLSSEQINEGGHTFGVVSSAATVNDAGQVNISLANVDLTNTRDVTITLDSATADYAVASAEVVTGPAKDSYNDFGQAEVVNIQTLDASSYDFCGRKVRVTLPTKSVVMLTLTPR